MKKQQFTFWNAPAKVHGGAGAKGRRKTARPLATKRPVHVILKSSRAKRDWSMLKRPKEVDGVVHRVARRFSIKLHRQANVGNHLHLLVQARHRRDLQNFLRVLPQAIAFFLTGTRKGNSIGKFWDSLIFTRIVEWGRDWKSMLEYLGKNLLEADGLPRERADWWFEVKKEARKEFGS